MHGMYAGPSCNELLSVIGVTLIAVSNKSDEWCNPTTLPQVRKRTNVLYIRICHAVLVQARIMMRRI